MSVIFSAVKPSSNQDLKQPFWEFAVVVYQQKKLKDICLQLQDRLGININVLLFACWTAIVGYGAIESTVFRNIIKNIEKWHEQITKRLRSLRRLLNDARLPSHIKQLRQRVLEYELNSEHMEQLLLVEAIMTSPCRPLTTLSQQYLNAKTNVITYLRLVCPSQNLLNYEKQLIEQFLESLFHKRYC